MTLRKPLTLMHEETQVFTSMVDGTSLRQPPKMVSHSSKRCRSDASFQACGGARSVETATSIVAITVSYPRRGAVETKLAGLIPHRCTAPAADGQPWSRHGLIREICPSATLETRDSIVKM